LSRGRVAAPPVAAPGALDETASFDVLDDISFPPGQLDSPSQISQGTVPIAGEAQETLAGASGVRRVPLGQRTAPVESPPSRAWKKFAVGVGLIVAAAAAAAAWFILG
jgi:hypothetical protein